MDWCRKAVIATAIDMRIFILANNNNKDFIDVRSYPPFTVHDKFEPDNFNPKEGGDLRYVRGVFKAMINKGYKFIGLNLRIIKARKASKIIEEVNLVDLPAGRGLSSSAALSVAVAGALHVLISNAKEEKPKMDFLIKMADIAYSSERKILGINCGEMDQYTSALGNIL
jgi:galactokinase